MQSGLPRIGLTATGKPQVILAENLGYSGFEKVAERFIKQSNAKVESKAESFTERVWTLSIDGVSFCLSWDDFICDVTVFAWKDADDGFIERIFERLDR